MKSVAGKTRFFRFLAMALSAGFVGVGLWTAEVQRSRLIHSDVVPCRLVVAKVERVIRSVGGRRKATGVYFSVRVVFSYQWKNARHEGTHVTPLDYVGTRDWADSALDRILELDRQDLLRAYVPRRDPTHAYLIREGTVAPYACLLISVLATAGFALPTLHRKCLGYPEWTLWCALIFFVSPGIMHYFLVLPNATILGVVVMLGLFGVAAAVLVRLTRAFVLRPPGSAVHIP